MHRILISVLFASALTCFGLFGQAKEFAHPAIISFETGVFPASADEKSELNISGEHFKHGQKSLQWKWSETDATLSFVQNIPYAAQNPHGDNSVATFVFWLYSLRQLPEAKLVFEFLKWLGKGKCNSINQMNIYNLILIYRLLFSSKSYAF